jgi:hypothetical protein
MLPTDFKQAFDTIRRGELYELTFRMGISLRS